MDDFYSACQERITKASDPIVAIDELVAISLHDLPRVQLCKFTEQAITMLSVIFQVATSSQHDLITKFQQTRQQLKVTLDYMERLLEAEQEFPSPQRSDEGCWW